MFDGRTMRQWILLFCACGAMSSVAADGLSWNYTQVNYQQPSENDIRGVSGLVSAEFKPNWVMHGRVTYTELDTSHEIELGQTRYDLMVGRVLPITENFSALLSAGYTHIDYRERLNGNNDSSGIDALNLQVGVRARFLNRFEADATVGVLADEDDVGDLLYELGLRYHFTDNMAFQIGVIGTDDASDFDELMYEAGFRFNLED